MQHLWTLAAGLLLSCPLLAQLSPEERIFELQNIASTYAKHYAPAQWKKQALGFDLFDLRPWVERVKHAKDDLEFHEICAEYVASLDDGHTRYSTPSDFVADLGFTVDVFDGVVLVEQVDRTALSKFEYPFEAGDELVSIDGTPVEELIAQFSKYVKRGNPLTTRRGAADLLTYRPQTVLPRAAELGDAATVVIKRQNGELQTYTIPWLKDGIPYFGSNPMNMPPIRMFGSAHKAAADEEQEEAPVPRYLRTLNRMRQWKLSDADPLFKGVTTDAAGDQQPRRYMLGLGLRKPAFGLPDNFVLRLGKSRYDFHYSGVFTKDGLRIGYLRVPYFPGNSEWVVDELETELGWMKDNTDGLILDVMRNPGGGCYIVDLARHFMPQSFYSFGEEVRVTWSDILDMKYALKDAQEMGAEQWVIDVFTSYLSVYTDTYKNGLHRSSTIPACGIANSDAAPVLDNNWPAEIVYPKPVVLLVDEFSISAADIFPSIMQDTKRALLVGTRTSGAGGRIDSWEAGTYTMASVTNTASLVVRKTPVAVDGFPATQYIENVGVHADVKLDLMTKDNLLNNGRPFMDALTTITAEYIRSQQK